MKPKQQRHWKRVIKAVSFVIITFLAFDVRVSAQNHISSDQEKVLREWTYSLAIQAATWGAPLVTMYALRYHDALGSKPKAAPNALWRMDNISTPELSEQAGYVTPNVNVIYGFGFMDLRQEPVILEVPDSNNRYYMVEIVDMYTNAFAYVGGKSTGYKGGKFALVGPGWEGDLPAGVKPIYAPTPWVLIQPRVHVYKDGEIDLKGAQLVLDQIKTTGLSKYLKKKPLPAPTYKYPAPEPINPDLPVSAIAYKNPLQFWELLVEALNENPPPKDQINALLPMFKPLGIELGKPWNPSLNSTVIDAMKEASKNMGSMLANLPFGTFYEGAFIPTSSIGNSGADYQGRAVIARLGLTANTPYEAVYWIYTLDKDGQMLTGDKKYSLTFKAEPTYYEPGFWSITLYDAKNNYTVPNPINRYMLGSDTKNLKKNVDGSFTLYIQKENPGKEHESNWLPAPSGVFYLIPRIYAPTPETIKILSDVTAWPIPVVTPVVSAKPGI